MGRQVLGATWLTEPRSRLLVVGPSLGTSSAQLWGPVADALHGEIGVLAWDLPGHAGTPTGTSFEIADLAAGVLAMLDEHVGAGSTFAYAGDSVGGAVGLELLLDSPERIESAALLSTGAQIGEASAWLDRAAAVRAGGTPVVVDGSMERWFSSSTASARPDLLDAFAQTLREVDREGYAQVCEALAAFDVRHRLGEVTVPVLAVAGAEDVPTPPEVLAVIADGVSDGRLVVLEGVAHLPPVEAPDRVARLVADHLGLEARQP